VKNFLTFFKILGLLTVLLVVPTQNNVSAEQSFGSLYIAITDAIMSTKQEDDTKAAEAIDTFQTDWEQLSVTKGKEAADVNAALNEASSATTSEKRLAALTKLSKSLTAYEKSENPVDEEANRTEFMTAIEPSLVDLTKAIESGNKGNIEAAYSIFLKKWTKNERVVREQNMAAYGQIETQMSFMRISLAGEEVEMTVLNEQSESLNKTIRNFVAGKVKNKAVTGDYSLSTLTDLLDDSKASIDNGKYNQAAATLKEFITIWPAVEGEVRTKNANLYTDIESGIPLLVSELSRDEVDATVISEEIDAFKQQIDFIQQDTTYSFWDSALILLREGLEALLIISALIAFLKKAGQQHMQRYIYVGAVSGIGVSVVAAVLMSTLFQSGTIGTSREVIEGYVGIIAAAMMLGVGIWLHSKATVTSWNRYISKQMNQALSMQSVWAMTFLSFLTVFREGAETIIFYVGIAPKMSLFQFGLGIAIAISILIIVALVLTKTSKKIPIHWFFAVATGLIYILAFKIIGASLHTLQLTSIIPTHIVSDIPVISLIGFYPSIETMVGQVVLLGIIIGTVVYKKTSSIIKAAEI
jgi:high-affinity iron transporter